MSPKARKSTGARRPILVSREIQTDPIVFPDASNNNKTLNETSQLGDSGFESEVSTHNVSQSRLIGRRKASDLEKTYHGQELSRSPPRKRPSFGNSSYVLPKINNTFSPRSSATIPVKPSISKKDRVQPLKFTPLRIDCREKKETPVRHIHDTIRRNIPPGLEAYGRSPRSTVKPPMSAPIPMIQPHPSNMGIPYFSPYSSMGPPPFIASPFTSSPFGYYVASPTPRPVHRQYSSSSTTPRSAY